MKKIVHYRQIAHFPYDLASPTNIMNFSLLGISWAVPSGTAVCSRRKHTGQST